MGPHRLGEFQVVIRELAGVELPRLSRQCSQQAILARYDLGQPLPQVFAARSVEALLPGPVCLAAFRGLPVGEDGLDQVGRDRTVRAQWVRAQCGALSSGLPSTAADFGKSRAADSADCPA